MPIVSLSINEEILKELDTLQKEAGFSGRSEVMRTALRTLLSESKRAADLSGIVEGVLTVITKHHNYARFGELQHRFTSVVKTQIHNHLENHKCLYVFVIQGDATLVKEFLNTCQASKDVEYAKLIVS